MPCKNISRSRSPILNTNKIIGRVQNYEFAVRGQRKSECKNRIIGERRGTESKFTIEVFAHC